MGVVVSRRVEDRRIEPLAGRLVQPTAVHARRFCPPEPGGVQRATPNERARDRRCTCVGAVTWRAVQPVAPTPRPFVRASALDALRNEEFDLTVIGGGITGAGVALDAASRGMRVALVEAGDFASGTSSKSSKLVHGGLRYLQQGEIGLVYEALAERQRLLRNAPHLVKVLPFLIPMFGDGGVLPAKVARVLGMAMWGYDLTGGLRVGKLHERLDR
ncbi:MAG: FAD-dependent oxidoreductase, partial [Actinobacteria bacterium]|nr:FAD-dependent oxidoreductase [Actinomycetota bacterium]